MGNHERSDPNTPFHANSGSCSREAGAMDGGIVSPDTSSKSTLSGDGKPNERLEGMTFRSLRRESIVRPGTSWRPRGRKANARKSERDLCSTSMALWLPNGPRPSLSGFTTLLREKSLRKRTNQLCLEQCPFLVEAAQPEIISDTEHTGATIRGARYGDSQADFLGGRRSLITVNAASAVTRAVQRALERGKRERGAENGECKTGETVEEGEEQADENADVGQTCDNDSATNNVDGNTELSEMRAGETRSESESRELVADLQDVTNTVRQNGEQSVKSMRRSMSFGAPKLSRRKLRMRRVFGLAWGHQEQAE